MSTQNSTAIESASGSAATLIHPNPYLNAILWGGWHWSGAITYYFDPSQTWNSLEKGAYRAALQSWANVANLTFQEVFTPNANFVERRGSNTEDLFLADMTRQEHASAQGGTAYGFFNYDGYGWDELDPNGGLSVGGLGYLTLVHELGHALGLAHPHDNGGGSTRFPGVGGNVFTDTGDNGLNQDIYTVMSYVHGIWTKPIARTTGADNYGYLAGPMAFDIAAMQYLYGANLDYHTGNDTYQLPDTNAAGTFWTCIWDAGGLDEIVYTGSLDVVIDLTAATLDNSPTGGGPPSYADGIYGGFTIANGVVIEHAQAGSGDDHLTGNEVDNILSGGEGADWLLGDLGNDLLNGDGGFDIAVFSGIKTEYVIDRQSYARYLVTGPDGTDTISHIEALQFLDKAVLLGASAGIDYEGAALAVYLAMNSEPPSDATTANLVDFEKLQYDYGSSIGVLDPLIYVWEALGQALCENAGPFGNTFGSSVLQNDGAFAAEAYEEAFGFLPGQQQITHFTDQVQYFESIYLASGAYGTDPARIELLARGAVFGQMLGISADLDLLA